MLKQQKVLLLSHCLFVCLPACWLHIGKCIYVLMYSVWLGFTQTRKQLTGLQVEAELGQNENSGIEWIWVNENNAIVKMWQTLSTKLTWILNQLNSETGNRTFYDHIFRIVFDSWLFFSWLLMMSVLTFNSLKSKTTDKKQRAFWFWILQKRQQGTTVVFSNENLQQKSTKESFNLQSFVLVFFILFIFFCTTHQILIFTN